MITGYQIHVEPKGNAVRVAVSFKRDDCFVEKPRYGGSLYDSRTRPPVEIVHPPNWLERMMGSTWERKIEKAKARAEKYAQARIIKEGRLRGMFEALEQAGVIKPHGGTYGGGRRPGVPPPRR